MADNEKVYLTLNDGAILVSSTRAVMNGKTYALANVTSVYMAKISPKAGCPVLLGALGAITLFMAISAGSGSGSTLLVGVVCLVLAGIWFMRLKPTYELKLASSSAETHALSSRDRAMIESVVDAINTAIVDRG